MYERQHDKLEEDLALAEMELNDARIDQADIEGVLALLGNPAREPDEARSAWVTLREGVGA